MPAWRKLYQKTTESLDVNDLPNDFTRLLWVLLPLGLDCEGRGLDNPSWVKAKIMPLRTDVSLSRIAAAIDCFARRGMILRYQVDGRRYFVVPTWRKYQGDTSREAGSIFPPPPAADAAPAVSPVSPRGAAAGGDGAAPAAPNTLATHSRPAHDPLADPSQTVDDQLTTSSRPDSDSHSDADADSDSDSDSPAFPAQTGAPKNLGERDDPDPLMLYQKSYGLSRLPPDQENTLGALATQYGSQRLAEVISWAASAGIPHARALRAISSALPGWRTHARSPTRAASRPRMLDVLDQLSKDLSNDP
jgi:hypothetical protein